MGLVANESDIDAVAAAWVVREDRGALSEAERTELDAWLAESSRHMGAYVRAQALWAGADRVSALDAGRVATEVERPDRGQRQWFTRRRLLAASVAAVLSVGVLAALGVAYGEFVSGRETTDLGEIRRITLEDGSSVVLNTASVVQVRFVNNERRVILKQGEASFDVAHDTQRPFIVQARDVAVKAVGTSFSVRLRPTAVSVTVAQGVVEVMRPTEEVIEEVRVVGRNRQVVAMNQQPMIAAPLTDEQLTNRLAWKGGLLIFDGDHLAQAIAEVNRYSKRPVILESTRLAERSFIGVFNVGDSRAFADAAAAAFDAHVIEREDGLHLVD